METLVSFITEPLAHEFMQRALILSVSIGVVCSIFSCFLVLKGWSLMGDAISHAVLPGLAIGYVIGAPMMLGAFVAGLFCALATGFIKNHSRVKEDAVMGIVFSGMFALGLVMIGRIESDIHLLHVLFGNVLGTSTADVLQTCLIAAAGSALMLIKRRDLMLHCFDPVYASAIGLPSGLLHFGLLALLALTIVASLQAAGIILVIAMLIAPGAIGFVLARRFDQMLMIAVAASVFSCASGTFISFHIDAATAPLIVVIQAALFIIAVQAKRFLSIPKGLLHEPK